jgi:hypothetical protein
MVEGKVELMAEVKLSMVEGKVELMAEVTYTVKYG